MKKHSTGMIIFWLIVFWPVAIYMIVQNGKDPNP